MVCILFCKNIKNIFTVVTYASAFIVQLTVEGEVDDERGGGGMTGQQVPA